MYDQWIAAIDEIAEVPGLLPTFVMNFAPKSAVTVSKKNGVGNTFGLNDDQSYICMFIAARKIQVMKY